MTVPTTLKLATGASLPRVGLGVFQTPRGESTEKTVLAALSLGYRHVDTAAIYGNEADVGRAVRASGLPRREIFVTTKLWNSDQGEGEARRGFDASLARLGLDDVDLYLLHWPVLGKRLASWRTLEKIHADGRAKAIGVSNFMVRHLEELLGAAKVAPHVNQIELSPFLQQQDVRAFCAQHGIVVEAYSPLTKGERLGHPEVVRIAKALNKTPAQVLLRWGLEKDLVVLPKSTRPERLRENLDVFGFELGPHEAALDALEEGLVTGWDPRGQR